VADQALARTNYVEVNGTGPRPTAAGSNAIAMGSGANANGDDSVAIGTGAVAENGASVSIGAGNVASGNGAVAIGDPNRAIGRGAVAIGDDNNAVGDGAVAVGWANHATGSSAIALGSGARAGADGSVAIGRDSVATRADQIALGSASSTYSLPGIGSSGSRAAQSGRAHYVTSDAAGNLALTHIGPDDFAALDRAMRLDRRDARAGIAASAALGHAAMPSEAGRTSYVVNHSSFRGQKAIGGSFAHRVATDLPLAVTAAFATAGNRNTLFRVGVAGEF
jgi:autotransporter adhesin